MLCVINSKLLFFLKSGSLGINIEDGCMVGIIFCQFIGQNQRSYVAGIRIGRRPGPLLRIGGLVAMLVFGIQNLRT